MSIEEQKETELETEVSEVIEEAKSEDQESSEENTSTDGQDEEETPLEVPEVTFGDQENNVESQEDSSSTIKHMRKTMREQQKALKQAQKELEALKQPKTQALRKKPTLEDHDYDEESYYEDLEKYTVEKVEHTQKQKKQLEEQENQQKSFQTKVKNFHDTYSNLSFKDKDDALSDVLSTFNEKQQSVIVDAVDNPAMIVYALGKNRKKLEELAGEENLVRFSSKLGKLETQMKVIDRKPREKPDTPVKGSGGISSTDKIFSKLEEEAERTGNRTELIKYKKSLKSKG